MKKIITIDVLKKDYPKFISKETNPESKFGYIKCEVEIKDGEFVEGIVISFNSNGKYKVELIDNDK